MKKNPQDEKLVMDKKIIIVILVIVVLLAIIALSVFLFLRSKGISINDIIKCINGEKGTGTTGCTGAEVDCSKCPSSSQCSFQSGFITQNNQVAAIKDAGGTGSNIVLFPLNGLTGYTWNSYWFYDNLNKLIFTLQISGQNVTKQCLSSNDADVITADCSKADKWVYDSSKKRIKNLTKQNLCLISSDEKIDNLVKLKLFSCETKSSNADFAWG